MENILYENQIVKALDYASGSATREGAVIAAGDGVVAVVHFSTIATGAVTSIKMQEGDESDGSDMADLEDSSITVKDDDDNQIFAVEIVRPAKEYVRVVVVKDSSNATAESAIYLLDEGRSAPVDNNVANKTTSKVLVSPAEGTA